QQEHLDTFNTFAGLLTLEAMTRNKRVSRHNLREGGSTKLQAFQGAKWAMPIQWPFHRSRAIASGIEIVDYVDWRAACRTFQASGADADRLAKIEETLA